MRMKEALNEVKERLNGYEISQWGKHTTSRDPSAQVMKTGGLFPHSAYVTSQTTIPYLSYGSHLFLK